MSFEYLEKASKIICIGRNYHAHIKELNNAIPTEPFFFLKPHSTVLKPGEGPILIPRGAKVHHEVELVVIIGKKLSNLDETFGPEEAIDAIGGYSLGIDVTARNVQEAAKKKGLPWTVGKGFDTFLPISGEIEKTAIPDPYNVELNLKVNGELRQSDKTDLMMFKIHELIRFISGIMTLEVGDIIMTGTPKGVGLIHPGDKVEIWCSVDGKVIETSHVKFEAEQRPGPYVFRE